MVLVLLGLCLGISLLDAHFLSFGNLIRVAASAAAPLTLALGVTFMVAEAFLPSFGVVGFGGIVAFVVGAVILMDTDAPGFGIPLGLIVGVATVSALFIAGCWAWP